MQSYKAQMENMALKSAADEMDSEAMKMPEMEELTCPKCGHKGPEEEFKLKDAPIPEEPEQEF